jgi:hypothetical protein
VRHFAAKPVFATPDRTGNNAQLFVAERLSNAHRAAAGGSPGATVSESLDVVAVDTSELEEDAAHLGAAGLLGQESSNHPSVIGARQGPASKLPQEERLRARAPKLPTLERGTLYSAAHEAADPNYAALNAQRLAEEEAEWEEARRPDEDIQFTSFDDDEGNAQGTDDRSASIDVPSAVHNDAIAGAVSSSASVQAAAQREISRRVREESTLQSQELERALHFDDAEDESQPVATAMTAARRRGTVAAAAAERDSVGGDDSESGGTMEWDDEMVEIHIPAPPAPEGLGLDSEPNAPVKQRKASPVAGSSASKSKFEKKR